MKLNSQQKKLVASLLFVATAMGFYFWTKRVSPTWLGDDLQANHLEVTQNGLSKASAIIETQKGSFTIQFYPKEAPITVSRFIELSQQHFYDGLKFHRVEPGFVVQGGDPLGNGTGGSGKKLPAEFSRLQHHEGTVAMARNGFDINSADSQFYVTLGTFPNLDERYTIFGQVTQGFDVVQKIQKDDKMLKITITGLPAQ
jgi:cyclophilin family peptidyl-prolyl cis-trans isomerase